MVVDSARTKPQNKAWPYLEFDALGRAKIVNTKIRISYLIQERLAHGWSPEEIHFQHPEISLPQIYSALSYYYTHQQDIDREIAQENQEIEALKQELKASGYGFESEEFKKSIFGKTKGD
ncbi:MAG: DUF433 domain-containing protein [Okeania sp. SIO3B5]|uniref:DUF433 domain-containing protein n=1 Tax=Okeania sp. SIO3B5 TaxID=2607811 RepID=UPI0014017AA1|nr:DUF433 domain-containing protein [Okeania sp. SIO3B5]NEO52260.1 DUF433 domain-containing protein [Okeania sp. SIO3B5]